MNNLLSMPAAARLLWPDLVRGACILLVVLMHADAALAHIGESDPWLHLLNRVLVPLRLPAFFLVSGLLGSRILARPAGQALRHRVGRYLYLFLLWWGLQHGVETRLLAGLGPPGLSAFFATPDGLDPLLRAAEDDHWFFYALAIFFGLALALRRLRARVQMALALGLALPGVWHLGAAQGWPAADILYFLPYFMLGVLAEATLSRLVPRLGQAAVLLPLGLLWLAATWLAIHLDPDLGNAAMALVSLVALPSGLGAAGWLAAHGGRWVTPLAQVGRRTMAIYALHPFAMHLLLLTVSRPAGLPRAAWVVLAAAGAVLATLAAGQGLRRVPGLFDLPQVPHLRLPWRAHSA